MKKEKAMHKEAVLYGVIGLLAGMVLMSFVSASANSQHDDIVKKMDSHMSSINMHADNHDDMSMAGMTEQLKGKTGDEFDKAFLEMMITHHEGAVEMAKLIPEAAKHEELKTMGAAIIAAQTKEIQDMKQWQKDWGYSEDTDSMMHGH